MQTCVFWKTNLIDCHCQKLKKNLNSSYMFWNRQNQRKEDLSHSGSVIMYLRVWSRTWANLSQNERWLDWIFQKDEVNDLIEKNQWLKLTFVCVVSSGWKRQMLIMSFSLILHSSSFRSLAIFILLVIIISSAYVLSGERRRSSSPSAPSIRHALMKIKTRTPPDVSLPLTEDPHVSSSSHESAWYKTSNQICVLFQTLLPSLSECWMLQTSFSGIFF